MFHSALADVNGQSRLSQRSGARGMTKPGEAHTTFQETRIVEHYNPAGGALAGSAGAPQKLMGYTLNPKIPTDGLIVSRGEAPMMRLGAL